MTDYDKLIDEDDEPLSEYDIDNEVPLDEEIDITEINTQEQSVEEMDTSEFLVSQVKESEYKLPELIKNTDMYKQVISPSSSSHEIVAPHANNLQAVQYGGMSTFDDDFNIARENIKQMTKMGPAILEDLVLLAKASEHPNVYKALTDAITQMSKLNGDLVDLYDKRVTIEGKNNKNTGKASATSQTQNNVFIGTTDDLIEQFAKNGLMTLYAPPTEVQPEEEKND